MILYVIPKALAAHVADPAGIPVVVELVNKNGDSLIFTIYDWVPDVGGGFLVLARLNGDGLDAEHHEYYGMLVDNEDLIQLVSPWRVRCEERGENDKSLPETDDV